MRIITRGKGIREYSTIKGIMTVDNTSGSFWLKLDLEFGKEQYIVELSKFEVAHLINVGLEDDEIMKTCKRQNQSIIKDFLE